MGGSSAKDCRFIYDFCLVIWINSIRSNINIIFLKRILPYCKPKLWKLFFQ